MAVNSGPVIFLSPAIGEVSHFVAGTQHPILGNIPAIMTGNGTPDADAVPFSVVAMGSLYIQMDAADDAVALFIKVDDALNADNTDWNSVSMT